LEGCISQLAQQGAARRRVERLRQPPSEEGDRARRDTLADGLSRRLAQRRNRVLDASGRCVHELEGDTLCRRSRLGEQRGSPRVRQLPLAHVDGLIDGEPNERVDETELCPSDQQIRPHQLLDRIDGDRSL
jgi:hypothetical protein